MDVFTPPERWHLLEDVTPDAIRQGLPADALDQFMAVLDLSLGQVADLLLVSESTLKRRRHAGRLGHAESDRLVRFARLVEDTVEAFDGNEAAAVSWLVEPKRLLDGESPLHYADTDAGRQAVEDMLGVIQYGMAA